MKNNAVELQKGTLFEVYTVRKIIRFEFYDMLLDRHRKMYVFPYSLHNAYQIPVLFELLEQGKIDLLCRKMSTVYVLDCLFILEAHFGGN